MKKNSLFELFSVSYGSIMLGDSNVILAVPHGFHAEEKGAHEAVAITAMRTSCHAIINSKIPRSKINLNDFVAIEESTSPRAKQFLNDLLFLIKETTGKKDQKTFALFVHGCPEFYFSRRTLFKRENGKLIKVSAGAHRPYEVDLGAGLVEVDVTPKIDEAFEDFLTLRYPLARVFRQRVKNSGGLTCSREQVYLLQMRLREKGIFATVGLEWPASQKDNLVQVVREILPEVEVMQLEFACDPEKMKTSLATIVDILTSAR